MKQQWIVKSKPIEEENNKKSESKKTIDAEGFQQPIKSVKGKKKEESNVNTSNTCGVLEDFGVHIECKNAERGEGGGPSTFNG